MISYIELKHKADNFYPVVILEKYLSYRARYFLKNILAIFLVLILFTLVIANFSDKIQYQEVSLFLNNNIYYIRATFFLLLSFWFIIKLLDAFFYSNYFDLNNKTTFELARVIFLGDHDDLTKSFFESHQGKIILMRLGIDQKTFVEFLKKRRDFINDVEFEMQDDTDNIVTMADYGLALYKLDKELQNFLLSQEILEKDFIGTIDWVKNLEERKIQKGVWWTREKLARIPSLGRNWSFGKVYLLEKYGHSIFSEKNYQNLGDKDRIYYKYAEEAERVLLKSEGSNCMIISNTSDISMSVVSTLGKLLINGKINSALEDKRIFVLDGSLLIDSFKSKIDFENNFNKILIQANNAGNVIVVIPRLPSFINSAFEIGVDVATVLAEFLSSSSIQIIALSDDKGYHQSIETNKSLMQHFEKITVKQIDQNEAINILQEESAKIESEYDILFTYRSLEKIAEAVTRYFSEGEYSDKILDILEEVKIKVLTSGKFFATTKEVDEIVSLKTGVPQGAIGLAEKEKLSNLEEILHQRVIGQNQAIESISKAIKRARSGIQNPNRPVGSFLFIGPTGVGKTETTKALAESFFGNEKNILRFDMSEYNSEDGLEKLIGTAGSKVLGNLASKIRQNQYGVLLLDEFEKADSRVHDLFLQIIDEGRFTDARGEEINARNLIIIATSNAGSDLIYQDSLENKNLALEKDKIVNAIIQRAIFKPELLNRFDGVILFHALKDEHISKIAKLILQKLENRLIEKGIRLDINQDLIDYLVNIGRNPQFGARAINRTVQDKVESQIAEAIIDGSISKGSIVKFVIDPQSQELKITV